METTKKCWLEFQHPEYAANVGRWTFARDLYTGEAVDPAKVMSYLVKKTQSESAAAFNERCSLADLTPHYPALIDSLAGMLFSVEGDANRTFADEDGNGLGDPANPETIIGRLWDDADGHGAGWTTIWKQAGIEAVHSHKFWVLVDSLDGEAVVRILPPSMVPNWRCDSLGLAQVLLMEEVDLRTDIEEEPTVKTRYVLYTREDWQRWEKLTSTDGKVSAVALTGEGNEGLHTFTGPDGKAALPILPVELPMKRQVGWLMAKKANAIFNRESDRDHLVRTCNFPFLNLVADDTLFPKLVEQIRDGTRALQCDPNNPNQHGFISPESGPAAVASRILERKVDEFYVTGFRQYGDSARERTATEVRQDVSTGVGAFLQHLKAALDDAENGALWRIEQIHYPGTPNRWFKCRVERSSDFAIQDPQVLAEKLAARYIGKDTILPIGAAGVESVVRQLAAADGITLDDAEVKAAVNLFTIQQSQGALSTLPIPAEARAELAVKFLAGIGYLDPEEEVELEGGGTKLKRDVVYEKALVIAEAQDQRDRNFLSGGTFGEELTIGE